MKDISVFIIENYGNKNRISHKDQLIENCVNALKKEVDAYNINADVNIVSIESIPAQCDANLICFLDQNMFIPDDFLNRAVALNNLFRDGGVFCGPVYTHWDDNSPSFIKSIEKNYHRYHLHFGNSQVCDITQEEHNYPRLIGSVFSGSAYNEIGYSSLKSPRHQSLDNRSFIQKIGRRYKILYAEDLYKIRYLTSSDMETKNISDYYYDMGFQDGLLLSMKNVADKQNELWHRFVESPELLDNEMPRWLYKDIIEQANENSGLPKKITPVFEFDYLEKLVILKCKYQIGFFEGMMGTQLV